MNAPLNGTFALNRASSLLKTSVFSLFWSMILKTASPQNVADNT